MIHQKIGYARVSTADQNLERQLDLLEQYGVEIVFQEKRTGTKRDRPELNRLLSHVAQGVSIVHQSEETAHQASTSPSTGSLI